MKYLYIFEDYVFQKELDQIPESDIENVINGDLKIIRYESDNFEILEPIDRTDRESWGIPK